MVYKQALGTGVTPPTSKRLQVTTPPESASKALRAISYALPSLTRPPTLQGRMSGSAGVSAEALRCHRPIAIYGRHATGELLHSTLRAPSPSSIYPLASYASFLSAQLSSQLSTPRMTIKRPNSHLHVMARPIWLAPLFILYLPEI